MSTLARRLLPLQLGVGLQGFVLWVPVEKLFMSQIGFDPASISVMATAYAAVVPLLEVPGCMRGGVARGCCHEHRIVPDRVSAVGVG